MNSPAANGDSVFQFSVIQIIDTIQLFPSETLFPLTVEEADEVELADLPELCPHSIAVHLYAGTWWRDVEMQ